jgi:glycerate 2-kinase
VLGAGKASAAMAAAVEAHYPHPLEGLVVTRYGHGVPTRHVEIVEAAHPVPDAAGAAAAERMLALADAAGADDLVLALVSGGGSALLSLPPAGVTAADIEATNRALLASGAPIDAMNCLRRHLSRITGGRLAAAAHPAALLALLISDVPGDDPVNDRLRPHRARPDHARRRPRRRGALPPRRCRRPWSPRSTIRPTRRRSPATRGSRGPRRASSPRPWPRSKPPQRRPGAHGLAPRILGDAIEGEARDVGAAMAREAIVARGRLGPGAHPLVLISGGETTVTLPRDGRPLGLGRAQRRLPARSRAGARRGGGHSRARLRHRRRRRRGRGGRRGPRPRQRRTGGRGTPCATALERYDGHGFFEGLGDQVVTGPTLTNVNDFRAILILPPKH